MAGSFLVRRSLLIRLLVLSAVVSLCSVAATAWLAVQTTTGAIQQEQGQALSDDARIYDTLIGHAATHPDWSEAGPVLRTLAAQTGHRITLTTPGRKPIADTHPSQEPLPARPTAIIDPLSVDTALMPLAINDRIDPRAAGPFAVSDRLRPTLLARAERQADCVKDAGWAHVRIVDIGAGRPRVVSGGVDLTFTDRCTVFQGLTPQEDKALKQLISLVNACLARHGLPGVRLDLDWRWTPSSTGTSAEVTAATDRWAPGCVTMARREQLAVHVAPAALVFVGAPGHSAQQGFTLAAANRDRIAVVTALVLLVALAVTTVAGMRLVRPLRALTCAAQRMGAGDVTARVTVTGHDEISRLAAAFNAMAERRAQLEDSRQAMVSDIAHELRTPLSNIRGWLEAVEDGVVSLDRDLVCSVLQEALLLQHIIDDLHDLSAADVGMLTLHPEPIDPAEVLAQVGSTYRRQAEAAGVELSVHADGGLDLVADPVRLRQMVGNLVSNAVRHTPAGGTVTMRALAADDQIAVEVADTGTGISPADLPYLFERFWRADKSRTRHTGGSGLGLAIVRKLAEAHSGTVTVTSKEGDGSTFTLHFPQETRARLKA
jgi:two-component system, OmpR family, sensor histidine kinase BaeS